MGSFTQGGIAFGQSIGGGIENYTKGRERRELLVGKALGIQKQLLQDPKRTDEDNKYLKKFEDINELGTRQLQSLISEFETGEELQMIDLNRRLKTAQTRAAEAKLKSMEGLGRFTKDMAGMEEGFPEDSRWSVPEYLTRDYANRPAALAQEPDIAAGAYPGDYWGREVKPIYKDVVMPPLPPGFDTSQRTGIGPTRRELAIQNLQEKYPGEEVNPMFQVSEPVGGMKEAHKKVDEEIRLATEKVEGAKRELEKYEDGGGFAIPSVDKNALASGWWAGGVEGAKAKLDNWAREEHSRNSPEYKKRLQLSKVIEEYSPRLARAKESKYALDHPEEYPSGFKGSVVDYEDEGAEVLPDFDVSAEGRVRRVLKGYDTSGMNDRIDAEQRAAGLEPEPEPLSMKPVEGITRGTDVMPMDERRATLIDALAQYDLTPADRKQAIDMISEKYPKLKEVATEVITADGEELGYNIDGTFVKKAKGRVSTPQGWRVKSRSVNQKTGEETVTFENPRDLPTYVPTASKYAEADPELTLKNENAPSEGQAKEFNTAFVSAKGIVEDAKYLIDMTKDASFFKQRLLDREFKAKVNERIAMMKGQMRLLIVGPGAMSEMEQKMLADALPDPSDFFRLDSATIARLEGLEYLSNRKLKFQGEAIGLWDYKKADAGGAAGATGSAEDELGIL